MPWEDKTTSISKTSVMTGGRVGTPHKEAFRESINNSPSWGSLLFRSTYTQSYATHDRAQARLLNHERLMLHSGGETQMLQLASSSLDNSLSRRPIQPFGGVSSAVWRR